MSNTRRLRLQWLLSLPQLGFFAQPILTIHLLIHTPPDKAAFRALLIAAHFDDNC